MSPQISRFLFAEANPRSVAMLRIWLGAATAFVFQPIENAALIPVVRAPWTTALYQDLFVSPAYWGLTLIVLAAFAAGLWSRKTGPLAAALLAPCTLVLGRFMGRFVMWFALAAFSLLRSDCCWALRSLLGWPRTGAPGPLWPIRLIQFQLTVLYFVNAAAKTTVGYLSGGTLAAMSQQLPNFQIDLSDGTFPLAGIALPLWLAAVASVAVEYSLAIGFWFPSLRWPTAALGVAFHWGLTWIVSIGRLDVAAMCLYPAFLLRHNPESDRDVLEIPHHD